jgi:hypothetical protein
MESDVEGGSFVKKVFLILMVLCLLAALPLPGLAEVDEDLNLLWDIPFENTPDQVKQQVYDAAGVVLVEDEQTEGFVSLRNAQEQELSLFGIPVRVFFVSLSPKRIVNFSIGMFPATPEEAASSEATLEKMKLLFTSLSEKYGKTDLGTIVFMDSLDNGKTEKTAYLIPESADGQPDYAEIRAAFETSGHKRTVLVNWAWKNVNLRFSFQEEAFYSVYAYWFGVKQTFVTGPLLELPDKIPPTEIIIEDQDLGL